MKREKVVKYDNKEIKAPWINSFKQLLGEEIFNNSPLSVIATKKWANDCKEEKIKDNKVFIKSGDELEVIYILVQGCVGIGGLSGPYNNYYVERLILKPFSFIGEIEAPMEIKPIYDSKKHIFKKIKFQDNAWVSSEALSKMMAWYKVEKTINLPNKLSHLTKKAVEYFEATNFKNGDGQIKGSEHNLFAKSSEAALLRIPLNHIPDLLADNKLCYHLYEDALFKAKRYCYISHLKDLADKIISVYHFAESYNLLSNKSLFILGSQRLHALTEDSTAQKAANKPEIKKKLEENGLHWEKLRVDENAVIKMSMPDELKYMWRLYSLGRGGNKSIYKISRMSNT